MNDILKAEQNHRQQWLQKVSDHAIVLRGLRILESAFNYLQEQGVAANEQH